MITDILPTVLAGRGALLSKDDAMINALGKYSVKLRVISDLSRLHPGGAPS